MDVFNGTNTGQNLWTNGLTASNDYKEKASYDENGNILTYIRHGYGTTPAMDSMTYHYNTGKNQLNYIGDGVTSGNYPNDLDNQSFQKNNIRPRSCASFLVVGFLAHAQKTPCR
jgi:hypothetical protein